MADDVVTEALEEFERCRRLYDEDYKAGESDLNFLIGKNHWDPTIAAERIEERRAMLTFNQMPQFVHRVVNDIRQASPAIRVSPGDEDADDDTAEIIAGKIREIEQASAAEAVYDHAVTCAVSSGYGYWRINVDYAGYDTFDQEIRLKRIENPFSVYLIDSTEPDGCDAEGAFVSDDMPKEEFERLYPDASTAALDSRYSHWLSDDKVRVTEYFRKEYTDETLALLSDGTALLEKLAKQAIENGLPLEIVRTRKVRVPKIKWYKLNAHEVLEERDWLGKYVPIIPVYGDEIWIGDKRICRSLISDAKDAQRLYNFWRTSQAEVINNQPKAPWMATPEQIKGFEKYYQNANVKNYPFLLYNAHVSGGMPMPPPSRQAPPMGSESMFMEALAAKEDIKSAMGIYDPQLGQKSNEVSGIAIRNRQIQGDNATFHFIDNLSRSIRHCGICLYDLIPLVYPGPRTMQIINADGTQSLEKVGQPVEVRENGQSVMKTRDLSKGKYSVVIDVGPSYASKRQQAVEGILEMVKAVPGVLSVAGDLLAKNMDWDGADEIAERMKFLLPPELKNDGEDQNAMALAQSQKMIQAMQEQIMKMDEALKSKAFDEQTKRQIEVAKLDLEKQKIEIERDRMEIEAVTARYEAIKDYSEAMANKDAELQDAMAAIDLLMRHVEEGEQEEAEPVENEQED